MKVKIVNKSAYETPFYATEKSAGMDLKANITEPVTLGPYCYAQIVASHIHYHKLRYMNYCKVYRAPDIKIL